MDDQTVQNPVEGGMQPEGEQPVMGGEVTAEQPVEGGQPEGGAPAEEANPGQEQLA